MATVQVKFSPCKDKFPYLETLNERQRLKLITTAGAGTGLFDQRKYMAAFQLSSANLKRYANGAYLDAVAPIQSLDLIELGTITYIVLADPGQDQGHALHAARLSNTTDPADPAVITHWQLALSAPITAVADGGAGNLIFTSPNHGLLTGQKITHAQTTDYDGLKTITAITDNTYTVSGTFTVTRSGTWRHQLVLPVHAQDLGVFSEKALLAGSEGRSQRYQLYAWRNLITEKALRNRAATFYLSRVPNGNQPSLPEIELTWVDLQDEQTLFYLLTFGVANPPGAYS